MNGFGIVQNVHIVADFMVTLCTLCTLSWWIREIQPYVTRTFLHNVRIKCSIRAMRFLTSRVACSWTSLIVLLLTLLWSSCVHGSHLIFFSTFLRRFNIYFHISPAITSHQLISQKLFVDYSFTYLNLSFLILNQSQHLALQQHILNSPFLR